MEQGPNPGSWQLHHRCAIQTQTRVGPLNRAFQRSSTTADHDNNADPVRVRGEKRWLVSLVVAYYDTLKRCFEFAVIRHIPTLSGVRSWEVRFRVAWQRRNSAAPPNRDILAKGLNAIKVRGNVVDLVFSERDEAPKVTMRSWALAEVGP
jgi:hypothetical protein